MDEKDTNCGLLGRSHNKHQLMQFTLNIVIQVVPARVILHYVIFHLCYVVRHLLLVGIQSAQSVISAQMLLSREISPTTPTPYLNFFDIICHYPNRQ